MQGYFKIGLGYGHIKKNMKHIIILALIWVGFSVHAQQVYTGRVVDQNNTPLAQATIQSKGNLNNAVVTNTNGDFSISLGEDTTVSVQFIGHATVTKTLTSGNTTIILEERDELLDVVVVSASRELQHRKEVPAAIAVVSAKAIAETKALGIDQLVNDVPGVFVATSRAASNEQHFTAVRTPISTRALFLYLEDGVPIRPTSVFNHNALLEMNDVSFERVEVLKGPASSIYGSEAIGASFNFITKNPTKDFTGGLGFQINDLGLTRYELELSQYANENVGFYIGTQYVQRENGPLEHSDYEKFALTFKNVNHLSTNLNWTNVFDVVDFRSDMAGSLSASDFFGGNFESDQTFTERDALAFRFRSTLDKVWNAKHKTALNFVFRTNEMAQNPSFRIRQGRDSATRALTGTGTGEVNNNAFKSYVGLAQHRIKFDVLNAALIVGGALDFSPQRFVAETTSITVDTETGRNTAFTVNENDFILNYDADILNYAGYFQFEINPVEHLKVTAALRYDGFQYDYNNLVDGVAGPRDSKNNYDNIAPKLGVNYNINRNFGLYANYSKGFTPPQASTLYRNSFVGVGDEVFDLQPSTYNNYEMGTYFGLSNQLKVDVALYALEGRNTLVTLRDANDEFFNRNAGKTLSYGIEYGVRYTPIKALTISHNGSFAQHRYIDFFERGIDLSDTDRETAPSLLGNSRVIYKSGFVKGLALSATHELVGSYNTSFENQVENEDGTTSTATYAGHNVFNVLLSYETKYFEVWGHALNIFDRLYSARASFNRFRGENSFTIGNPRAFHFGIRYKF